ncbi:MAG TPA: phage recombination protein Bet [Candidatus Dormibacteraeota bacterium]|jgi:phage recombination protein Bet
MSEQLARPGRFDQAEMQVVKDTIAPGCSDSELMLFAKVCERTGLDPFARQIYALKRKAKNDKGEWEERLSIQTSIDGLRVIAERTNNYRGQVGPQWCGEDGEWKDVWLEQKPPAAARVGIVREGFQEPVWAIALHREYVQTYKSNGSDKVTQMWESKPTLMLAKCAEALALRKAFPNDMSGVYTEEEIPPPSDAEKVRTDLEDVKRTGLASGRHTAPALTAPARDPKFTGSSSEIPGPAKKAEAKVDGDKQAAQEGEHIPADRREMLRLTLETLSADEASRFWKSRNMTALTKAALDHIPDPAVERLLVDLAAFLKAEPQAVPA